MSLNSFYTSRLTPTIGLVAAAALALTACGGDTQNADADASASAAEAEVIVPEATEVASIAPRIVLSHEGGIVTLDSETGEVLHSHDEEGFWRLNNAGDGQFVWVSGNNQFRAYNAGIQAATHGDHYHYYSSEPLGYTGAFFDAEHPGHVVNHSGKTTLFADGTGAIQTYTSAELRAGQPIADETATADPHHGVALELSDGTLLTTQGTEDSRNTIQHVEVADDGSQTVLAETDQCPGVHGEAAAAYNTDAAAALPDIISFGCEDGPVIFRDGQFHKVEVEPEYQRSGNQAGSYASPIVLADWKTDADAELERPTEVALINTLEDTVQTVDLGSSYWFRSLARDTDGSAVVLTYDGEVNVIDPETGQITAEIPAIAAWEEKDDWQQPGPILQVADGHAYVTDAENQELVVVNLEAGEVENRFELDFAPVEMAVLTGVAEGPTAQQAADQAAAAVGGTHGHDHAHEGEHDHDHAAEGESGEAHDHSHDHESEAATAEESHAHDHSDEHDHDHAEEGHSH